MAPARNVGGPVGIEPGDVGLELTLDLGASEGNQERPGLAIRAGDLLTTSPTPGHATLAKDALPGTVIGKALEPLEVGMGTIRVS